MNIEQIVGTVRSLDGALVVSPAEGDGFPELAWGDHFCYYAPDGRIPTNTQPYATVVTKNYPDDERSDLDGPGRWRLNIHVGRTAYERLTGAPARDEPDVDFAATDVVLPHPVYGRMGWVAVVNPGPRTADLIPDLLRAAHADAVARAARRAER